MGILNERIKSRRLQLGYTLLYIADQLGVKEATAQRYESGDILRCSPVYLMGFDSPVKSSDLLPNEAQILLLFRELNSDGQNKLIERAEELRDLGYTKGENAKMA